MLQQRRREDNLYKQQADARVTSIQAEADAKIIAALSSASDTIRSERALAHSKSATKATEMKELMEFHKRSMAVAQSKHREEIENASNRENFVLGQLQR